MTSKRAKAQAAISRSSRAKRRPRKRDDRDPETRRGHGQPGCCWCGEPGGHDWEGKDEGKPHPR